ncbi:non-ribosomal peptide synthetase [Variovorax sp. NFACC27]|uniref:non-ribosomal peptide synthetase n=1 Tax=unclassified Variovorax TaxID=663243 RepID=UPI000897B549|nr:amino acid adenylation domain-containing protein [Variovorax sp. NFACC28]SEG97266.1 amino acid adenylation domain-containing protein [Variovorax sp. NFACC29]SFD89553.1 amino acid adenylation domain-containing protein [Variovorax sp. NFACC26]SFH17292.1 amino acid adenylation domain-containing protein [Variovorax sp. NFACC27]
MNAVLKPTASGGVVESIIATTESQREVWLGATLGTEASMAYNESVVLRLRGELDQTALSRAMDRLLARHQALRSTISPDGTCMLVSQPRANVMVGHDLAALEPEARAQALRDAHEDAVCTPFSLEHGPLFRAVLYRLGRAEHELVMSAHHVVCDGWSWAVITEQLGHLYAEETGTGLKLKAAPLFADFAAEEAAAATHPDMQAHVDYWLGRFPGSTLPVLDLPLDRPRPAARTFNSLRAERLLDKRLVGAVRTTSTKAGVSLFTGLLSGFVATLHRLTGQEDIVVGIPASGQLSHDMPGLVGHCVNLLPLRLAARAGMRFDALMDECSTAVLDAFDHQALTYGALLGQLSLERDPSRLPLVSVAFNVDPDVASSAQAFTTLDVVQDTIARRYENFELFVNLRPLDGGLMVEAQYNTDLFDEVSVQRWLDMFACVLQSASHEPDETVGRLEVLSADAVHALLALQPARVPLVGAPLAHAGFVARAPLQPDRPAVRDGARSCSYGELESLSNRLARALRARGVGRGQRVGLCLERSLEMVVAMLGVLKAGASYVPLDTAFPQARLDHYASDAKLALMLTSSDIAVAPRDWRGDASQRIFEIDRDTEWRQLSGEALPPGADDPQSEDAAYVIYTSGSTGLPKGVIAHHRGVAHLLQWMQRESGIGPADRIAAVTTLSFDMAVPDLLLPLAAGAELVMVKREVAMDGNRLSRALDEEQITLLQATPGMWQLLLDAQWAGGAPGFRGWTGGEALRPSMALALCERMEGLWNGYGPTETTVYSTAWHVRPNEIASRGVSIGRPVDNTEIWILDADLQPCPIGVPGEICIAGEGVSLGYLDRPELTAERFVTVRIFGTPKKMYRSGDRGRWRNDGLLDHLGRLDFQVKVRGYRIEPGEIEVRCCEVEGVSRAVVIAREDNPGDVRLVAYLALKHDTGFDLETLMVHLRKHLPAFMLPQHVVTLDMLPKLANGKIDRVALPPPQAVARDEMRRGAGPRNEHERKVLALMEKVLSLPGLDMHDDFFTMGGHSLLAARLTTLLSREFQVTLPLRSLFESPTAEKLAAAIQALQGAGVGLQAPIGRSAGRTTAPLTMAQERIRFMEQLHPGRSVYNAPSAQRLTGQLDAARFEEALRQIIRRQPSLRTRIDIDADSGKPVQAIAESAEFTLPLVDLRDLPADQREAELAERMQELADRPIDIHAAPMMHATLFRLDDNEHVFQFVPHHLIWDGWSFDLMQRELAAFYDAAERGRPHNLPALMTTQGDYAQWLEKWLTEPACEEQLAFWRGRLEGARAVRPPVTDMPRRAGKSGQGGAHWIHIDLQSTQRLREIARDMDVTLSMLTFGVYALTMAQVTGNEAIVIANPVRGRQQAETEDVMGFFNNVLPVSLTVDRSLALPAFMRYVKQELLSMMNNQQVPFERLMAEPGYAGQIKTSGPYQSMFSFQDARERTRSIGSLQTRQMHVMQHGATDDIGVWLMDKPHGLEGALIYNADVYLRETGAQLRERYLEVLRRVAEEPGATLERIADAEGSTSAAYLRKLAASDTGRSAATGAANGEAPKAKQSQLEPEQAQLALIWAGVIGIDVNEIRASDNFFDLGGDSLLVLRAVQQAAQTLGHRVEPRRYLFENLGQIASSPRDAGEGVPSDLAELAAGSAAHAPRGGLLGALGGWLRKG